MPSQPDPGWSASIPWIVAAMVAAVGWCLTHLLSEARERRKEVRSQIDKLFEQLYKLEQDARGFHCCDKFDEAKAGDLMSKLQVLERTMARVSIFNEDRLVPYVIALRRSISLRNFDKSTFSQQPHASDILQDVFSASRDLEDEMEHQYRGRYLATFPYFRFGSVQ